MNKYASPSFIKLVEEYRNATDPTEIKAIKDEIKDRLDSIKDIAQDAPASYVWEDIKPSIKGEKPEKKKQKMKLDDDGNHFDH